MQHTYREIDLDRPWKQLKIINREYFEQLGLNVDDIKPSVLDRVEFASMKAIEDYQCLNGTPPLIGNHEKLPLEYVDIQEDHDLHKHGYCEGCPKYIREVNPCFLGCQLNCQYCLVVSNESIQTQVKIFGSSPN